MNKKTVISNISLNDSISSSFQKREGKARRRLSIEFMTLSHRSSTPVKAPISIRLSRSINERKKKYIEHLSAKKSLDDLTLKHKHPIEKDASFMGIRKRLKSSESTLSLYETAIRPLKRKCTMKESTMEKSTQSLSTAFCATEVTIGEEETSFLNISSCSKVDESSADTTISNITLIESKTFIHHSNKR